MNDLIKKEIAEHIRVVALLNNLTEEISNAASLCIDSIKNGGKVILFGNGGSAADCQHIAAELVGRYKLTRKGLPAIALTTDTSAITAIANDFGFDHIFDRQLEAIANREDIVIGISTSGSSPNVISALRLAKKIGCKSIGLTGISKGEIDQVCNLVIPVPSDDTARIQEMHILIGHTICHLIEMDYTN